jgi:hypothetical protein
MQEKRTTSPVGKKWWNRRIDEKYSLTRWASEIPGFTDRADLRMPVFLRTPSTIAINAIAQNKAAFIDVGIPEKPL